MPSANMFLRVLFPHLTRLALDRPHTAVSLVTFSRTQERGAHRWWAGASLVPPYGGLGGVTSTRSYMYINPLEGAIAKSLCANRLRSSWGAGGTWGTL